MINCQLANISTTGKAANQLWLLKGGPIIARIDKFDIFDGHESLNPLMLFKALPNCPLVWLYIFRHETFVSTRIILTIMINQKNLCIVNILISSKNIQ
jgi:hypothetical protein